MEAHRICRWDPIKFRNPNRGSVDVCVYVVAVYPDLETLHYLPLNKGFSPQPRVASRGHNERWTIGVWETWSADTLWSNSSTLQMKCKELRHTSGRIHEVNLAKKWIGLTFLDSFGQSKWNNCFLDWKRGVESPEGRLELGSILLRASLFASNDLYYQNTVDDNVDACHSHSCLKKLGYLVLLRCEHNRQDSRSFMPWYFGSITPEDDVSGVGLFEDSTHSYLVMERMGFQHSVLFLTRLKMTPWWTFNS